jgi:hypothetical protein
MKRLMIVAALLACACTPPTTDESAPNTAAPSLPSVTLPVSDQAGNRMEALIQHGERWCTDDGVWCVESGLVSANGAPAIALPGEGELWAVILRSGETALVGRTTIESTPYSGGGAHAMHLTFYEIANGAAREVLRIPYAASAMIRACFSEQDEEARAGACHDEYAFNTRISLDESVSGGSPRIVLETAAGSYPGAVTRTTDSAERGVLTEADLVWAHDETCSYRRTYTRGADGLYTPDQELPACSDYLEP